MSVVVICENTLIIFFQKDFYAICTYIPLNDTYA